MDPLSDVLALLGSRSYAARGFQLGDVEVQFRAYEGIKCYAVASGACRLAVDGFAELFHLRAGDCFVLPRGRSFRLAADSKDDGPYLVGGYFLLTGPHAPFVLEALPPIVHIRDEAQKATMRWSLDRLVEELRDPQPGGSIIAQQIAYTMLVQALRLHLVDPTFRGVGWLSALADRHLHPAMTALHADPAHPWTVKELAERAGMSRSVFAVRFKETVGSTPMEYLTRWRMLRAGQRLGSSNESVSEIAVSLGYESDSAFRKAFRVVMGCSPRAYGARLRQAG